MECLKARDKRHTCRCRISEISLWHLQVLAPRIGYLPLLVALIKPYFKESLPPGEDSIWFDYKGFPLKWYAIVSSDCIMEIHCFFSFCICYSHT